MLTVKVYDENYGRADVLIGEASTSIINCAYGLGTVQELKLVLKDDSNRQSGKIAIYGQIDEEMPPNPNITAGTLFVKRISLTSLKNTDFLRFSKLDPV